MLKFSSIKMHDKKFYFIILLFLSNFLLNCIGLPLDICYGTNAVEFLPHPESCINYILCVLEFPTVLDCEPNQIYNQANSRCEPGKFFQFLSCSTYSLDSKIWFHVVLIKF